MLIDKSIPLNHTQAERQNLFLTSNKASLCGELTIKPVLRQFNYLTLLHSEPPKLWSFGSSECNRVNSINV